MKPQLFLLLTAVIGLSGCQTYTMPNGQTRTGLSPAGAALAQVGVATAIGLGTGALMKKSPSWATGAVGGAAGNVGSQVLNMLVPSGGQQYQQPTRQYQPAYQYQQPVYQNQYQQQRQYPQQYQQGQYQQGQYIQLPNGQVVRVQ